MKNVRDSDTFRVLLLCTDPSYRQFNPKSPPP
jgi:hypothetical protein